MTVPTVAADVGVANLLGFLGTPMQLTGDFLELAILFFVLALIAAVVGARDIAGVSMQIAKILVAVFLILAIVSLLL
ncbi:DUF1328 domain-containing protein [Natronomonas salina]|nr:DUF1328 domain-containing protein [Natronomonas salina]